MYLGMGCPTLDVLWGGGEWGGDCGRGEKCEELPSTHSGSFCLL